jgi:hypothetical protein
MITIITFEKFFIKAFLFKALIFYTLFFSANVSALTINAETDKKSISKNETFNLIVTVDDNASADIDFTQLSYQFDILGNQRSSRLTISNGKKMAKTFWVLLLAPKETGTLTIPSFSYKNIFSSSITIIVTDNLGTTNNNLDNPDIFFEVITDKKTSYVQEQILVKARLYYRTPLANYENEGLKVDKARVEQVFEENREVNFRGQRYKLLEEVYTVHPQASGKIKIPIQTWRLEKPSKRFGFGNSTNPYIYVRSEELIIDVRPIAEAKTDNSDWLPSEKISLSPKWKQSPLQATIGEPLNLQITITAQGLADYQLPNLSLDQTSDFTIFEAQAETINIKSADGVTGVRKLNYSVIPRQTGQFILPKIFIRWWNVNTDKEEVSILPEQAVIVAKSSITDKIIEQNQALPITKSLDIKTLTDSTPIILWQIISSIFFIIICLLFYRLYKIKKNKIYVNNKSFTDNFKHSLSSQQKIIINNIKINIENNNWQGLRKEVISWGQLTCEDETLDSLNKLALKIPELSLHLKQLDNFLYGQQTDVSFNPHALLDHIKNYKINKQTTKKSVLKEIY